MNRAFSAIALALHQLPGALPQARLAMNVRLWRETGPLLKRARAIGLDRRPPNSLSRVMLGAKKMERDVRLVAYHPTVVAGPDVEKIAGFHFIITAIVHPAGG
jgi:hypothetical protein